MTLSVPADLMTKILQVLGDADAVINLFPPLFSLLWCDLNFADHYWFFWGFSVQLISPPRTGFVF